MLVLQTIETYLVHNQFIKWLTNSKSQVHRLNKKKCFYADNDYTCTTYNVRTSFLVLGRLFSVDAWLRVKCVFVNCYSGHVYVCVYFTCGLFSAYRTANYMCTVKLDSYWHNWQPVKCNLIKLPNLTNSNTH